MKVTAKVERVGSWWAIEVPEVPGAFTQAKRLDQVAAMAADAVSLLTGEDVGPSDVVVEPHVPDDARAHIDAARRLREESTQANTEAAAEIRAAARALARAGLPLRDIGSILGVSHQRAHQLVA
jgi:hypothetical protein